MTSKPETTRSTKRPLEAISRQALDDSLTHIDAATLSRLNQARQQALAIHTTRPGITRKRWLKQTAFASLAILAIGVWTIVSTTMPTGSGHSLDIEQGEYIASAEDLEVAEDLEFIAWLLEQDKQSHDDASHENTNQS